jgi:hypothetical protein
MPLTSRESVVGSARPTVDTIAKSLLRFSTKSNQVATDSSRVRLMLLPLESRRKMYRPDGGMGLALDPFDGKKVRKKGWTVRGRNLKLSQPT